MTTLIRPFWKEFCQCFPGKNRLLGSESPIQTSPDPCVASFSGNFEKNPCFCHWVSFLTQSGFTAIYERILIIFSLKTMFLGSRNPILLLFSVFLTSFASKLTKKLWKNGSSFSHSKLFHSQIFLTYSRIPDIPDKNSWQKGKKLLPGGGNAIEVKNIREAKPILKMCEVWSYFWY